MATEAAKEAILGGFEVSREGTCGGGCEDHIGRRRLLSIHWQAFRARLFRDRRFQLNLSLELS